MPLNLTYLGQILGSWREISKIFNKDKFKYFKKRMFIIDHGVDTLIYLKVKVFLVKELCICKSKSSIKFTKTSP